MQNVLPEHRRIVPQWRSIRSIFATNELASPGPRVEHGAAKSARQLAPELVKRIESFRTKPDVVAAAELVESAIILGEEKEAMNAARVLVGGTSTAVPLVRNQAARLLQRNAAQDDIPDDLISSLIPDAPNWRRRIRENAEDSISWVELSRVQLCNGHLEHAKKSMDVALSISPNNRHVLRSAARLYFQSGEFDKSYDLIRSNIITPSDPWLMAAEVALAGFARKTPFFVKIGLRLF